MFDLDHTLLTCNCSFEFGRHLYRRGWISTPQLLTLLFAYSRHKFFNLSLHDLHHISFNTFFRGHPLSSIQAEAALFIQTLPRFYFEPALRRLTPASLILSSSPNFLVEAIARSLGIKSFEGTSYDVDKEGRLCQISEVMDGQAKAKKLQLYAGRHLIKREQIIFYTDSFLDEPVFALSGTCVAVNPDKKLRKWAKENQWEILDESSICRSGRNAKSPP